ncbi:MAG: hypothetical protein HYS13_20690 [Planctomycetia bacterium]|nr:hypothetical protein [Planctomycetia bacterium]
MTIRFLCPMGHRLAVPDERAGKKGRCPICNQRVYIPRPDPLAAKADKKHDKHPAPTATSQLPGESAAIDEPDEVVPWDEATAGQPDFALPAPASAPEADSPPPTSKPLPSNIIARPVPPLTLGDVLGWGTPGPAQGSPPPAPPDGPPILPLPTPVSAERPLAVPVLPAQGTHFCNGPHEIPEIILPPALPDPSPAPAIPPPVVDVPAAPPPAAPVAALLPAVVEEPQPLEGYEADAGKVQTVYMLAAALAALTVFAAAPALRHMNLSDAPGWARAVLILSALQLVYVVWMVSLPDWSTVYIGMIVFAIVSAAYGVAWALVAFTPTSRPINFLDLDEVRRSAAGWCLVVLLLGALCTYACGRFSGRWRREFELAKARRGDA